MAGSGRDSRPAVDPSFLCCMGLGGILGVGIVAPGAVLGAHEPSGGPKGDGPTASGDDEEMGEGRAGTSWSNVAG